MTSLVDWHTMKRKIGAVNGGGFFGLLNQQKFSVLK